MTGRYASEDEIRRAEKIEGDSAVFIKTISIDLNRTIALAAETQRNLLAWTVETVADVEAIKSDLRRVEAWTRDALDECNRVLKGAYREHEVCSPIYAEERGRWWVECACGWEYEGKTDGDVKHAGKEHLNNER